MITVKKSFKENETQIKILSFSLLIDILVSLEDIRGVRLITVSKKMK